MPHRSRYLVDPELASLLDRMTLGKLDANSLAAFRGGMPSVARIPTDHPVREIDVTIEGQGGHDLALRIFRRDDDSIANGVVVHMHGGGYVGGSVESASQRNRNIVSALGCLVVAVDYRLAPEHVYPAAIDDCYSALGWAIREAAGFGAKADRIGVKGESAGGGLAIALALLARDRKEHRVDFVHTTYPMIDDRTMPGNLTNPFAGEFVWTAAHNEFGWRSMLGDLYGAASIPFYAAPARCEDLTGFPPTFLMTASLDLFLGENMQFAKSLAESGVPIEFHSFAGAFHGFEQAANTQVAKAAGETALAALRHMIGA